MRLTKDQKLEMADIRQALSYWDLEMNKTIDKLVELRIQRDKCKAYWEAFKDRLEKEKVLK